MDVSSDADAARPVRGLVLAQASQREQPYGEVAEVLSVLVGRLADPESSRPAEHPFDIGDELFSLIQPNLLPQPSIR